MRTKQRVKTVHGSVGDIPPQKLGDLRMRLVNCAGCLNISFLHEELPRNGAAPTVVHCVTTEFVYMLGGSITGTVAGKKIELKKGDYLMIPPGVTHKFTAGRGGGEAISVFSPPIDPAKPDAKIISDKNASSCGRGV